jgi:hypothetical protein
MPILRVAMAAGPVVVVVMVMAVVQIVAHPEGAVRAQGVLRPSFRYSSLLTPLLGSSKGTSARQTGETGGAPPPPPPPPPQVALAVDGGRPRGFPSHQNSFEFFNWTTTVVGLAVLFFLGKRALNGRNAQRINRSADICPVISASCPTVIQIPPDMCLRPDLASVYDPSSYPTPSCLPRQGPFCDWGCERVLDGVQFNISTEDLEAFETPNGAARPQQNEADTGYGSQAPTIATPALSRLDAIILSLFSLVIYLMGHIHRLPGRPRGTPADQHPGGTSHVSSNCCICQSTFFLIHDCLAPF